MKKAEHDAYKYKLKSSRLSLATAFLSYIYFFADSISSVNSTKWSINSPI